MHENRSKSTDSADAPFFAVLEPTLENLAEYRRRLQEFCNLHVASLEYFRSGINFKVITEEPDSTDNKAQHLSSTATCYSSIEDCPLKVRSNDHVRPLLQHGVKFADAALDRTDWKSDGSADIYCRCRTLPFAVSHISSWRTEVDGHFETIFEQWSEKRTAIGEADPNAKEWEEWYPPNAYHTFWALESIDAYASQKRFAPKYAALSQALDLERRKKQMCDWGYHKLTYEVALHSAGSSALDSDQLAWSLAIFLRTPDKYQWNLPAQDLVRHAFFCLFGTQEKTGTWRHYGPLFHYLHSGNAYCYVFETFTWLLKQALRPGAEFARSLLKGHFGNLIGLWKYATRTQTVVVPGKQLAWSSGHRPPSQLSPESWATASVFAYAQALRRLVGIWARDSSLASLNHRRSTIPTEKTQKDIGTFSTSWRPSGKDIAELVWSMFVNPVAETSEEDWLEPDDEPIKEGSPRSAILFGPPGTGKTSLVSAIAAAIGWDYVELHPSHFVAEGLPEVQHTADRIFRTLMDLDHAVVLLDEVDELVRERDIEPDQFGRFLTTSMLPRLAELWKARKVMYFVATNHIEYFDRAVTRSQRFDAILYIGPPSFATKIKTLTSLLKDNHGIDASFGTDITKEAIEGALPAGAFKEIDETPDKERQEWLKAKPLTGDAVLAKFALLRFDELAELASDLATKVKTGATIGLGELRESLDLVKDKKSRTVGECYRFANDFKYERYDVSKVGAWRVEGYVSQAGPLPPPIEQCGKHLVVNVKVGALPPTAIPGYSVKPLAGEAKLRLTAKVETNRNVSDPKPTKRKKS